MPATTSKYPAEIDSFAIPLSSDTLGSDDAAKLHTNQHAQVNSAINKIETELGTNPRGSSTDVAARLRAIESSITKASVTRFGGLDTRHAPAPAT